MLSHLTSSGKVKVLLRPSGPAADLRGFFGFLRSSCLCRLASDAAPKRLHQVDHVLAARRSWTISAASETCCAKRNGPRAGRPVRLYHVHQSPKQDRHPGTTACVALEILCR